MTFQLCLKYQIHQKTQWSWIIFFIYTPKWHTINCDQSDFLRITMEIHFITLDEKTKRIVEWFFSAISVSKASPGCCVCQQWSHSIWCSCHGDEAICGVLCPFSAVVNQLLSCPYSLTWYSIYYILVIFLLQFWHCICED